MYLLPWFLTAAHWLDARIKYSKHELQLSYLKTLCKMHKLQIHRPLLFSMLYVYFFDNFENLVYCQK